MKINKKKIKYIKNIERKIDAQNIEKRADILKLTKKIKSKEVKSKKIGDKFNSILKKISNNEYANKDYKLKLFEVEVFDKKLQKLKYELNKIKKEIPSLKIKKKESINDFSNNNLKKDKLDSIIKGYERCEKNKIDETLNEELVQLKVIENSEMIESCNETLISNPIFSMQAKLNAQKFMEEVNKDFCETNLLNSWNNEEREAGVEISYEREDGKFFHFEVSKKDGEEVEVNFKNSLSNLEIRKLKNQTGLKING